MMFIPYVHAAVVADRFLALLARLEIDPGINSSFDDELLSPAQLLEIWKNPNLASPERRVEVLRVAAGVHDFAAKVLAVENQPEFPNFVPHLELIGHSKISGSVLQNQPAANDTARKMTELYVACLALHIAEDVKLDHPEHPVGDNPDVMFAAQPLDSSPKQMWAIAIKSVATKSGQTIYDRIREGVGQIDRCSADRGLVLINVRDSLNHALLSDESNPFATEEDAIAAMRGELERLALLSDKDRLDEDWERVFAGKTMAPVLFLGQSLAFLETPQGAPMPIPIKAILPFNARQKADPYAYGLSEGMNDFMQNILLGIPGSHGTLPR